MNEYKEFLKTNDKEGNMEHIPYVQFLELSKRSKEFEPLIINVQSPFMRMLQIDDLFFQKKIIKMEKGDGQKTFNEAKKELMGEFDSTKSLN